MPTTTTTTTTTATALHVTPLGGAWAVKLDPTAEPASIHPTRSLALAEAFERLHDQDGAEVLIHGEDGQVRSTLTIRQAVEESTEAEDAVLRAEAERITPSSERLQAMIGRLPLPVEGADLEADPADLY